MLGHVEDPIVRGFRHGGGVGYGPYARFHVVMAELSEQGTFAALFDAVLPLVAGAEARLHENCGHPMGAYLHTVSCMHCMAVSLAQGGEGLGAMWGDALARTLLDEAGFGDIERHELGHDLMNACCVMRA